MEGAQEVIARDLEQVCSRLANEFSQLAGKHLLITGAAGFLGYYLVQAVTEWNKRNDDRRIRVTAFENYARGTPDWFRSLEQAGAVRVVRHDVSKPMPNGGDFEYIIHAAGIASPMYYRAHPLETMDANVNGLRHLLDYCRSRPPGTVRGVLFFSSSEIYGDPEPGWIPTPETYRGNVSCTGPRACYDESKRYGETLCVVGARHYGLPIRIARPFNNYGPGLKITDRRVIPDFARDILAGRNIVLYSDGRPTRTFCYVADAVVGYYKILVNGRDGEAYNIGTEGPEVSMGDLAGRLATLARDPFGYEGSVVRRPPETDEYLVDNPSRRCPAIAKARAELGYEPCVSLDDGLRRTLIWYAGNREAEDA